MYWWLLNRRIAKIKKHVLNPGEEIREAILADIRYDNNRFIGAAAITDNRIIFLNKKKFVGYDYLTYRHDEVKSVDVSKKFRHTLIFSIVGRKIYIKALRNRKFKPFFEFVKQRLSV